MRTAVRPSTAKRVGALVAGAALVAAGASMSAPSGPGPGVGGPVRSRTVAATADAPVEHVVVISVDGLTPHAIGELGRSGAPALHRLMRHGATTLNARALVESTITLPNHTGMVTGRRVRAKAGGHGVTFNEDDGSHVHRAAGEYVVSMFDVAHDRGRRTALYASKPKFNVLGRSWDRRRGAVDRVGKDHGRAKLDRYGLDTEPDNTTRLVRRLRRSPDHLSFLHLGNPDRAGHEHGYRSGRYLKAVTRADEQVARVLQVIARRDRLRTTTNVVLVADHGGIGHEHSEVTRPENYTVPFMVWGVGVPSGADLYALNATTRLDPGADRPGYRATPTPIRNGEVANLALDLLGLPAVPESLLNTGQDLAVR